jgi:hypothetical protein
MWTPFKFFIGVWQDSGQGRPGSSRVDRKYEFVLNGNILFVENKSVHDSQEKNPRGEIHEDWGLISYDRARETYVFRQFHVEGFVNQYKLDKIAEDGQMISFATEGIKNIAPGWKAKESYRILGPDEFIEVFELAPPDKESKIYTENHFQRVR